MLFVWEKGKTMDFSETIVIYGLKLATDDWSDEVSVDIKTLSPEGSVPPALGLYTCIKSWNKMYNVRFQRHFVLNLQQMKW